MHFQWVKPENDVKIMTPTLKSPFPNRHELCCLAKCGLCRVYYESQNFPKRCCWSAMIKTWRLLAGIKIDQTNHWVLFQTFPILQSTSLQSNRIAQFSSQIINALALNFNVSRRGISRHPLVHRDNKRRLFGVEKLIWKRNFGNVKSSKVRIPRFKIPVRWSVLLVNILFLHKFHLKNFQFPKHLTSTVSVMSRNVALRASWWLRIHGKTCIGQKRLANFSFSPPSHKMIFSIFFLIKFRLIWRGIFSLGLFIKSFSGNLFVFAFLFGVVKIFLRFMLRGIKLENQHVNGRQLSIFIATVAAGTKSHSQNVPNIWLRRHWSDVFSFIRAPYADVFVAKENSCLSSVGILIK